MEKTNKSLAVVVTDGEIELIMLVDSRKLKEANEVVEETREEYYKETFNNRLFDDVLLEKLNSRNIDVEFVDFTEM